MIIDHNHAEYRRRWRAARQNKYNGAFYYSKEILANIVPRVDTDRNWITVNLPGHARSHSIIFIHNNLHPERYDWLKAYDDLILVCGIPETCELVKHIGKAIYLPLSIDKEYVKQFKIPKEERHGACFAGRPSKRTMAGVEIPKGIDIIENLPRQKFLQKLARYEEAYAVGRCAIEAKCLGLRLKAYDERFPKVSVWKVVDNADAAVMLQRMLDEIDGRKR